MEQDMVTQQIEKAWLFVQAFREAGHLGEQAMLAVAFALRNRQRAGWEGGNWALVVKHCNRIRYNTVPPNDEYPDLRDPIVRRVMTKIDSIYDGSAPDTFVSCVHPTEGARTGKYWAILHQITNPEFLERIVRSPNEHPKTSTVGDLTFFA
jgi:hypothetical protein